MTTETLEGATHDIEITARVNGKRVKVASIAELAARHGLSRTGALSLASRAGVEPLRHAGRTLYPVSSFAAAVKGQATRSGKPGRPAKGLRP